MNSNDDDDWQRHIPRHLPHLPITCHAPSTVNIEFANDRPSTTMMITINRERPPSTTTTTTIDHQRQRWQRSIIDTIRLAPTFPETRQHSLTKTPSSMPAAPSPAALQRRHRRRCLLHQIWYKTVGAATGKDVDASKGYGKSRRFILRTDTHCQQWWRTKKRAVGGSGVCNFYVRPMTAERLRDASY